jgi:phosphatidylglycerol:prolipoprotein diacylglycerol transferase
LSLWGFAIGAVLGGGLYLLWRGGWEAVFGFADAVAPVFGGGAALLRIGCFLNGCDFGTVTGLPWGVCYGPGTAPFQSQVRQRIIPTSAAETAPVHPVQLYETLFWTAAALALLLAPRLRRWELLEGEAATALAVGYAVVRFLFEYIRGDAGGRRFGPLTFTQATAATLGMAALSFLIARRLSRTSHRA